MGQSLGGVFFDFIARLCSISFVNGEEGEGSGRLIMMWWPYPSIWRSGRTDSCMEM